MAFEATRARIPTSTGDRRVLLEEKADGQKSVEYTWEVRDQDGGTLRHAQGNLVPHFDDGDAEWLQDFMDRMDAKAQKLIPVEA